MTRLRPAGGSSTVLLGLVLDRSWREAWMRGDAEARRLAGQAQAALAMLLAVGIFALDILTPLQGAVAVLYTAVVLVAANSQARSHIATAGAVCAALAIVGYVVSHRSEPLGSPAMRLGVSLVAIAITTTLSIRHQAAADERRRSDERYRAIFNAAGIPIWESDWSGALAKLRGGRDADLALVHDVTAAIRLRDANQAAARLFGRPDREDLLAAGLAGHHTPSAEAALARIFAGLMRGDATIEEEMSFRTAAGDPVDVVLRVTLPPHHDGWKHVLVMALDVTERNRAQARLAQAQAELTHVSRVTTLGQLAASIAHEVNQPLSAIITYARSARRWLAREAPDAPEVSDCLDHIAANGARAADVIARIRDMARKGDPKQSRIDLRPLVEETIALLRRDLQAHEVDIRVQSPARLPLVQGDRVQMQQVLMNLMLNAEQAMAETPTDRRAIGVEVARDGDGVAVQVRDFGPGIVGVDPESLFRPFFTTKADGLGMGLSICRSIVEQHGGTLTAANHPGGGASFRFRLPAASAGDRAAA